MFVGNINSVLMAPGKDRSGDGPTTMELYAHRIRRLLKSWDDVYVATGKVFTVTESKHVAQSEDVVETTISCEC